MEESVLNFCIKFSPKKKSNSAPVSSCFVASSRQQDSLLSYPFIDSQGTSFW